jgi:hypothetical protein
MEFDDPGQSGDKLAIADVADSALIIRPTAYEAEITTSYGPSDAIRVDVVNLKTGDFSQDVLWFSGYVVGSLKGKIGKLVLAKIYKGDAKPGQSPPWLLEGLSGNAEVRDAATKWMADNPGVLDNFDAPATPAPAPQSAGSIL